MKLQRCLMKKGVLLAASEGKTQRPLFTKEPFNALFIEFKNSAIFIEDHNLRIILRNFGEETIETIRFEKWRSEFNEMEALEAVK